MIDSVFFTLEEDGALSDCNKVFNIIAYLIYSDGKATAHAKTIFGFSETLANDHPWKIDSIDAIERPCCIKRQ